MAMLKFASDMFHSSIAEAQKCFAAPIDHTRHDVKAPNELTDSRKVREPAPPPARSVEPAIESEVSRSLCSSSEALGKRQIGGWSDISLGPTRPSGCATSDSARSSATASISVVVVGKDGRKISSTHDLSAYSESGYSQNLSLAPAEREQCPNITSTSSQGVDQRRSWQTGSIVEVYSSSGKCWHAALVLQVKKELDIDQDMLTLQFWLDIDDAKRKTLCRSDANLQPLGTHCQGQLPVGFQEKPSRSRPGHSVFVDATTGLRYESIELAWAAHFKRWLEYRMPVGSQTIRSVNAVIDTAAPSIKQEAPQENDLNAQAPEGLVTEFAMSREHRVASTSETPLTNTNASACEDRACIGLVTEYESDWNTVRQGGNADKASARPSNSEIQSRAELERNEVIVGTHYDKGPSDTGVEVHEKSEQNRNGDLDVWVSSSVASETEAPQELKPKGPKACGLDVEMWRQAQRELQHNSSTGTVAVNVSRPLSSEAEAPQEVALANDELDAEVLRPLASEAEAEVQQGVEQNNLSAGALDVQESTPSQHEPEHNLSTGIADDQVSIPFASEAEALQESEPPNVDELDAKALRPLSSEGAAEVQQEVEQNMEVQQEAEQHMPSVVALDVQVSTPFQQEVGQNEPHIGSVTLTSEAEAPEGVEVEVEDSSTDALDAVQVLSRSAPNASSAMVSCAAEQDAQMQQVTPAGLVTVA